MKSDLIDVEATAVHMTDKAILVTTDGENKVWLPFSKIELQHRGKVNEYVITMPETLAVEKGLI